MGDFGVPCLQCSHRAHVASTDCCPATKHNVADLECSGIGLTPSFFRFFPISALTIFPGIYLISGIAYLYFRNGTLV